MIVDRTSAAILRIRVAAGSHHPDRCPICRCRRTVPARRRDVHGRIVEGCVDAAHSGFLTETDDAAWHARPEAFELRVHELRALTMRGAA